MKTLKTLSLFFAIFIAVVAISGCAVPPAVIQDDVQDATQPVVQVEPTIVESVDNDIAVESPAPVEDVTSIDENGVAIIEAQALDDALATIADGELTEAEVDGILFMVEEEKLARDVYLTLGEQWGTPIFSNIARSEQSHMDALATLVERYDLDSPTTLDDIGVFANSKLQELYDQLIAAGSASQADALMVGAAVEEIDIIDLVEYTAETEREDIILVYENLTKGSRNHLRAFISNLERLTGEEYEPQYMDEADYEAIISSEMETGGYGQGGSNRGKGRGQGRGRQG